MSDALITKYRPSSFDEVIGHDAALKSLEGSVKKKLTDAYLFTGPSGVGKTTLARITAKALGCTDPFNLTEIDAATNTGIEAMRGVTSDLIYKPLGSGVRAIIVDEVHALSKAAAQSLLKVLEEPPEWVYWFLCTTEPTRVLPTLRTRCLHIDLKPVPKTPILELLSFVNKEEKLKADPKILALCAEEAQGSPRQALSYLAACASVEDLDDALELLGSARGSPEAIDLARLLSRRSGWSEAQALLKNMKELDAESIRRVVQAYLTTVILNAKNEKEAGLATEILDNFSQPFYHHSNLVLACAKVILG